MQVFSLPCREISARGTDLERELLEQNEKKAPACRNMAFGVEVAEGQR